jgi:large subunit ribosomal protein L21
LQRAGITTVAQIAELETADIARLAAQIKAQAERIERDDWVGQAQQLIAGRSQPAKK